MSGTGESRADFAGEERVFRIRLGEVRHIEAKCGVGIGEVLRRLSRAVLVTSRLQGIEALAAGVEIHADDVRETIFRGLKGGGMGDGEATKLVGRELDSVSALLEHAGTALSVLWASQEAPDDGPLAAAGESPATQESHTTSPPSTE